MLFRHHANPARSIPLFSNGVLMFIGKISYGMYLYYLFFPWLYPWLNEPLHRFLPDGFQPYLFPITIAENFVMLIGLSWLSYRYFEKPLLQLKVNWRPSPAMPAFRKNTEYEKV